METTTNDSCIFAIFKIDHCLVSKNALSKDRKEVPADWIYSSRSIQNVREKLSEILTEYSNPEFTMIAHSAEHFSVHNNKKVATMLSYTRNTELLYEYMILSLNNPKKKI